MADLHTTIAGLRLPNPVMPASGTYEYSDSHRDFFSPGELGAVVNKTVFPKARPGNSPPRMFETPCGMLNAIGIPSKGIDFFVEHVLPRMAAYGVPVIVSVAGESTEEFVDISRRGEEAGSADIIELNLSCPNLSHDKEWAQDESLLQEVIEAVGAKTSTPLAAKLSPAVTNIAKMARLAEKSGASILSLINTFKGIVIDTEKRKPVLGNVSGGLSGPAILPLSVFAVYRVYKAVSVPIIGMGGIAGPDDALQLVCAGASAVAVGMYNFVDPMVMKKVVEGIDAYLDSHGIARFEEIIGSAHRIEEEG